MPESDDHRGPPWARGWNGPPPWAGGRGPGFGPPGPGFGRRGRRFRRGAFIAFSIVVLFVAALASVVASIVAHHAPAPWITIAVAAIVVIGLVLSARWLWRSARSVGALMDAADRVAEGDYTAHLPEAPSRQLRRLTDGFNQMTERLQTNEQRRRELLADVAHELRTPLQVIRGSVEGMLDGLYPVEPGRLRPLLDETDLMARLLDDLRTLSMAEAGVLQLHRETVDPRAIVDNAVQMYRPLAQSSGISLESVVDGAPATIEADGMRLSEVLANILTNAVRHTPSGGSVTVRVQRAMNEGVGFEVEDTGPGIPSGELPYVFDRFVTSADAGGTGLGLAIAKRLVELHGGTIEAGARDGGGTRITVKIPAG